MASIFWPEFGKYWFVGGSVAVKNYLTGGCNPNHSWKIDPKGLTGIKTKGLILYLYFFKTAEGREEEGVSDTPILHNEECKSLTKINTVALTNICNELCSHISLVL